MDKANQQVQIAREMHSGAVCLTITFPARLDASAVEQMAEEVDLAMGAGDDLRLVLDFSGTIDIAAEAFASPQGFVTSVKSIGPIKRYAVVDAPDIAAKMIEFFGAILPLEANSFDKGELEPARQWAFSAL